MCNKETLNKKHNPVLGIMKGIAILSVVAGHALDNTVYESFVNQYHLATFFFVSGYFFQVRYVDDCKRFMAKRIKSLYIPFVVIMLLGIVFHNLLYDIYINNAAYSFSEILTGWGNALLMNASEQMFGAMWFCRPLFLISVMFCLFMKMMKTSKEYYRFIMIFTLAFVCYLWIYYKLPSPQHIVHYMIIIPIFYMGYLFRKYEYYIPKKKMYKLLLMTVCLLVLVLFTKNDICAFLQPKHIANASFGLIYLIGLTGCIMVYLMAGLLTDYKVGNILDICGNYSFSIMAFHFFGFKIVSAAMCLMEALSLSEIVAFPCMKYTSPLWFLLYCAGGITLPIILSKIYHQLVYKISYA